MSLINEALKKAQRMRHEEGPGAPSVAPTDSTTPAASVPLRRGKAPRSQWAVFAVAIPLVIGASVGLTWWLLRTPAEPAVVRTETPATPAPAAPAPVTTAAAAAAPAPVEIVPVALPPIAPPPAAPEPAVAVAVVAPPAPEPAAAVPPAAAAATPAAPAGPKSDPRVNAFLDTLRVTGIRASATDPRVSMNERVFRLNDIVDRTLELRIIGIAPEGLTFIDPAGTIYKVQF